MCYSSLGIQCNVSEGVNYWCLIRGKYLEAPGPWFFMDYICFLFFFQPGQWCSEWQYQTTCLSFRSNRPTSTLFHATFGFLVSNVTSGMWKVSIVYWFRKGQCISFFNTGQPCIIQDAEVTDLVFPSQPWNNRKCCHLSFKWVTFRFISWSSDVQSSLSFGRKTDITMNHTSKRWCFHITKHTVQYNVWSSVLVLIKVSQMGLQEKMFLNSILAFGPSVVIQLPPTKLQWSQRQDLTFKISRSICVASIMLPKENIIKKTQTVQSPDNTCGVALNPHWSCFPVLSSSWMLYSDLLTSDVPYTSLACPLDDLPGALSGLTFLWICPRCGLWPQRWNSCNITQIDCLLPVLALLSCCRLELHQRKIVACHRPSLTVALNEEKQTQPPPLLSPKLTYGMML